MTQIEMEECPYHEQLYESEEHTMRNSVPTTPYQVCETRDRSHERMLNRAFPTLYRNQIGHTLKGHTQVGPDRRSDDQEEDQRGSIYLQPLRARQVLSGGSDKGDRQSIHDVIDQPDNLPGPVALGQVPVSFKESVLRTPLMY